MNLVKVEVNRKVPNEEILAVSIDGKIRISKGLCDKLKLVPGMKVDFFQDTENEKNWFVHLSETGSLQLRKYQNFSCIIHSRIIAKKIRKHFCFQNVKPIQIKLAEPIEHDGKNYHELIYLG